MNINEQEGDSMNVNQATKEKLEKTIGRIQKAIEYNDQEYISELVHDLTEFAYFAGYKEAEGNEDNQSNREWKGTDFSLASSDTVETQISALILNMGIPSHIKGYRYLVEAVALTYEDPTLISRMGKELYPYIAKKYNTTASRVERAIRHSIEIGWSRGGSESLSMILGYPVNKKKAKPTNSEYIHLLTNYIRVNNKKASTLNSLNEQQSPEKQEVNYDQPTESGLEEKDNDKELIKAINEMLRQLDFNEEMFHFRLLRTLIYLCIRNPQLLKDETVLHNQLAVQFNRTTERVNRVIQDALSMRFPALKETLQYQGLNPMKLSVFAELVIKKLNLN
jgi:two-component system, response regulator, stage 0 sporulation protein A